MKKNISTSSLIFYTSLFLLISANNLFFQKIWNLYPWSWSLVSISLVFLSCIYLMLTTLCFHRLTKPVLILVIGLSSLASYVMNTYGTVIDEVMILNILHTDAKEAQDLFNLKSIFTFLFFGLAPAILIAKIPVNYLSFKHEFLSKFKNIGISLVIILSLGLISGKFYASFLREQKPLRYYTNPTYFIYSAGKYANNFIKNKTSRFQTLGLDAKIPSSDKDRELIIFVLGETARADHFSLNGYKHETNPLLKKENVISFPHMTSCGTSTAISVPCMFSNLTQKEYSSEKFKSTENLLDVLIHTKKVNILWRDNNSSPKGVTARMTFENFQTSALNTICDDECRDEGMLIGLQDYINKTPRGDIFIVLHQMGNHGPAYYKRYPKAFEKFNPICRSNELNKCSNEEIQNTYDNAILYTDYFLAKSIELLKKNSHQFETALFYVSDHGESLGERGLYLHGLPYFLAPPEQTQVASLLWLGPSLQKEINMLELTKKAKTPLSHDYIFHTVLGLMEIETNIYNKDLDILTHLH